MDMIDLGHKIEAPIAMTGEVEGEEKISYPTLYVPNLSDPGGIQVGDEFVAKVKMKKIELRERDDGTYSCEYEVHGMEVLKKKRDKSFEESLDEYVEA